MHIASSFAILHMLKGYIFQFGSTFRSTKLITGFYIMDILQQIKI